MGIHQNSPLIDVAEVRKLHALTGDALVTKQANDEALAKIIKGEDKRILLVIGPCSSDNEEAVLDYAHRLAKLQEDVKDKIFIVMRVYTAKPRTNGDGYKGSERMNGHIGTETRPRLLREAAVGNLPQWTKV